MTVWILLTGFLFALAIILIPLFRYRADASQNQNQNMTVYKAQLRELAADQNNGTLSETEAAAARLEIERRLLKVADDKNRQNKVEGNAVSPFLLVVAVAIILLLCMGFYLNIGMPGMPDFILKDQEYSVAKRAEKNEKSVAMLKEVADIKTHLLESPTDIKAWRVLGHYQSQLHHDAEAAQANQRWYELEPENVDAAVVYAESLIILSDGRVGPAAMLVLNRARTIQPDNPGVRHYLALTQYQAGNISEAYASWKALETDSDPKAPWLRPLRSWIRQAEKDLGIKQKLPAPAMSDEQRATINKMSLQEQADMIKAMVARLQDKMDKNPTNIEGWFQLSKAYEVIGQKDLAIKSLVQALKHAPDDVKPRIKKQLEILLKKE